MLKVEVFMLFAFVFSTTSAQFWRNIWDVVGSPSRPQATDCRWKSWTSVTGCEENSRSRTYVIKQRREKQPERNGGRPCSGSSERVKSCSEMDFVGAKFYASVRSTSSSRSRPTAFGFRQPSRCTNIQRGVSGKVRFVGVQQCRTGRRKRSTENHGNSQSEQQFHREKRQTLSNKNRDILFLIDESGSVGSTNFMKIIRMAKALTKSFCQGIDISEHKTRVGVMSFDKRQHVHFDFDRFFQKSQILDHMSTCVKYSWGTSGRTCLVDTLKHTRENMITTIRGARKNVPGTERVVIMFTDGCANCFNQGALETALTTLRGQFEADGTSFITFFIGNDNSCPTKLLALADGSQCHQVFTTSSWAEFDQVTTVIENMPCMTSWTIGVPC